MDQLRQQTLDFSVSELYKFLAQWLAESSKKDMNSQAALRDLISKVFTCGVSTGLKLAQKVNRGEL